MVVGHAVSQSVANRVAECTEGPEVGQSRVEDHNGSIGLELVPYLMAAREDLVGELK